ncbi:MAG: hypothetical protein AAFW83_10870 [Pseudomonadota bacterium]
MSSTAEAQNTLENQDLETKDKPVECLDAGNIRASIWENEGQNGKYHSVTFSKSYQDKDGNWQRTGSFNKNDVLKLSHIAG